MDAAVFIVTLINDALRQRTLFDDLGTPSWTEGQLIRAYAVRLKRGDASAWKEFQQCLDRSRDLTLAVLEILIDQFVVLQMPDTGNFEINLPGNVKPLPIQSEKNFLSSLNVRDREPVAVYPDPRVHYAPDFPHLYKLGDPNKFIAPSKSSRGEIMYIEMKPRLAGPARIGRVTFSHTRRTIYYDGKKLQSLKGSGYKANYYNVESGMWYWISKCQKDGNDALYPATIEIDDDVREEYWTDIRKQPENIHLIKFKSPGKYSKRRPC
jgi:hypothetical protein